LKNTVDQNNVPLHQTGWAKLCYIDKYPPNLSRLKQQNSFGFHTGYPNMGKVQKVLLIVVTQADGATTMYNLSWERMLWRVSHHI
jgi:hypothetical protein